MRMASILVLACLMMTGARAAILDDGRTLPNGDGLGSVSISDRYSAPFSSSGPHLPVASSSVPLP